LVISFVPDSLSSVAVIPEAAFAIRHDEKIEDRRHVLDVLLVGEEATTSDRIAYCGNIHDHAIT